MLIKRICTLSVACLAIFLSGCLLREFTSPSGPGALNNVVFIGDSLTAGFQNGSLLDKQQPNGFANLVAEQAKFSIELPLIAPPGAPAVLELVSTGFPPDVQPVGGVTIGRDNPAVQPTDLAVPGHMLHDILYTGPTLIPTNGEEILTNLVLGLPVGDTKSQLQEAIALKPSTIFVWAGSDDALQADESGMPSQMTSLTSFTTDFTQLMTSLKGTGANIIVANIPDVTQIPYMTPAQVLLTALASTTGLSTATLGAGLGLTNGDLLNTQGLEDAENEVKALSSGGILTPLPDGDVLTVAEIDTVQTNINNYNTVIQQQTTAAGGTLVDMHAYFNMLQSGISINGYMATTAFLGGLFSLDGIHPTNTGYALLANQFILALNTKFNMSIAQVNVQQVAMNDPYFGPNIKPANMTYIPIAAGRRSDDLITGWKSH